MPQRKPPQKFQFLFDFILPKVEKHLRKRRLKPPLGLHAILMLACYPDKVKARPEWYDREWESFRRCFQETPDAFAEALWFINRQLQHYTRAIQRQKGRAIARDFLLKHNCVVKKRGKLALIQSLGKEDLEADGFTVRAAIKFLRTKDLYDCEIAALLGIKTDDVRKARASIA
jgi:hypothetical protein